MIQRSAPLRGSAKRDDRGRLWLRVGTLSQSTTKRPSFGEIRHVVVLMQENRSFDYYFGTLAGVRGFDAPEAMKLPDGQTVFRQPDTQNSNPCVACAA